MLWLGLAGPVEAAASFGATSWISGSVKQGSNTLFLNGGLQAFTSSLDFSVGESQGFSFDASGTIALYDMGAPYVFGANITPNLNLRLTNFSYVCRQASCDATVFNAVFYARSIGGFFENPIMTNLSIKGSGSMVGSFQVQAYFGGFDGGSISPLLALNETLSGSPFSFSTGTFRKYRGTGLPFDPISLELSLPGATLGQTLSLPNSLAASVNTIPSAIPEPGSALLLTLGLGAIGYLSRQRRSPEARG